MKLSEILYENAVDIWDEILEHPFVTEMALDELDIEKYRYYMIQDYIYLMDYIKIFAVLITKSSNINDMNFFIKNIYDIIQETLSVHIPYMEELGINQEEVKKTQPHLKNTAYSHYMLWESERGSIITGLTALLNCSWSYAYIAEKTVEKYPQSLTESRYSNWFEGYISERYRNINQQLIDKVDEIGSSLAEEEIKQLKFLFRQCALYDADFWNMAYYK